MCTVLRAAVVSVLLVAPFAAQAATMDLTVIGATIAAGTSDTATYSGDAAFGTVTFTASPAGSDLTASSSGLGIDCSGWDLYCRVDSTNQIDYPEILEISFAQPKYLTSVTVSNLFPSQTVDLGLFSIVIQDMDAGSVTGSGFSVPFSAADANSTGLLSVGINQWATSIRFVPVQGYFEDFSVAALTIDESALPTQSSGSPTSPIPEPSSVLMMAIGGALVLLSLRRAAQ